MVGRKKIKQSNKYTAKVRQTDVKKIVQIQLILYYASQKIKLR